MGIIKKNTGRIFERVDGGGLSKRRKDNMEKEIEASATPMSSLFGEIQLEMDHLPSREEMHEAKKAQLRAHMGEERFDRLFGQTKDFFRKR